MDIIEGVDVDQATSATVRKVTLKVLARHVGLTPGIVSLILNNNTKLSVPKRTRDRVFDAAQALGYRPNLVARALRTGEMPVFTQSIKGSTLARM